MRRTLIFASVLSMLGLGTAPLSACAILSSQQAECAAPATQSDCEHMNMDDGAINVAALMDTSCCHTNNAPAPTSLQGSSDLPLATIASFVFDSTVQLPQVQEDRSAGIAPDLSPPALQTLFCIFLI